MESCLGRSEIFRKHIDCIENLIGSNVQAWHKLNKLTFEENKTF